MKTVFITRDLTKESIFKRLLEKEGLKVLGETLIEFSAVVFDEIPKADWVFFYSKNGVEYFFQNLERLNLNIPENVKWATIGSETAKALTHKLKNPDFIGNGNAESTAVSFLKIAKGKTVVFPQAKASIRSIQQYLDKNITAIDLIVYKNSPKKQVDIPYSDFIVLTSPLNVKVYFKNSQAKSNQKLIAIGQTTADSLVNLGINGFEIAETPSEKGLAKAIIKSLKSGS